jgi:hypothetical protein
MNVPLIVVEAIGLPLAAPATKQVFRVELSFEPDEQLRSNALATVGLFVLVSSRPLSKTFTASDVLEQYREQHQVETAFRWLKQPGAVAPMFLHKPSRLAALGLVFALALAVYRIIQHRVRTALANTGQTIPGNNHQPTKKPTTTVVAKRFHNVHRIIVLTPQGERVWLQGLTPAHELVLAILELPIDLGLSENRVVVCRCLRTWRGLQIAGGDQRTGAQSARAVAAQTFSASHEPLPTILRSGCQPAE